MRFDPCKICIANKESLTEAFPFESSKSNQRSKSSKTSIFLILKSCDSIISTNSGQDFIIYRAVFRDHRIS